MSRNERRLAEILAEEGTPLLRGGGDYGDAKLFVDGHHLSRRGASQFSAELARLLDPLLSGSPLRTPTAAAAGAGDRRDRRRTGDGPREKPLRRAK